MTSEQRRLSHCAVPKDFALQHYFVFCYYKYMKKKAIIYAENTDRLLTLVNYLVQDDWEIISGGDTAEFLSKNLIPYTMEPSLSSVTKGHDRFTSLINLVINSKSEETYDSYTSLDYEDAASLLCVNIQPKYHSIARFLEESSSENCIDLKHVSLIRAAAKNYSNVLILTDPEDYEEAIIQLKTESISKQFRLYLAGKALNLTSAYDASCAYSILFQREQIDFPNYLIFPYKKEKRLAQGANNHQQAWLYSQGLHNSALAGIKKIQGKEVDYNLIKNYFAAWNIVSMFLKIIKNPFEVPSTDSSGYSYSTQFTPAAGFVFTIGIKYGNPIGAALGTDVCNSFTKTLNCAPETFDGATLGCSAVIDRDAALLLSKMTLDSIIAPDFTKEAREILAKTNSLRLIVASNTVSGFYETATIDGGLLAQISDHTLFKHWNVVTTRRPTQAQIDAMAFGTMISLGAKSDSAIIINDSAAIGISFGQPNRRKAVLLAVEDAKECFKNGLTSSDTSAEILVSDTSIPFDDKIRNAVEIGVKAIIQTGGSSSDQQLIDYCNENDIAMVFTGMRHIAF